MRQRHHHPWSPDFAGGPDRRAARSCLEHASSCAVGPWRVIAIWQGGFSYWWGPTAAVRRQTDRHQPLGNWWPPCRRECRCWRKSPHTKISASLASAGLSLSDALLDPPDARLAVRAVRWQRRKIIYISMPPRRGIDTPRGRLATWRLPSEFKSEYKRGRSLAARRFIETKPRPCYGPPPPTDGRSSIRDFGRTRASRIRRCQ